MRDIWNYVIDWIAVESNKTVERYRILHGDTVLLLSEAATYGGDFVLHCIFKNF